MRDQYYQFVLEHALNLGIPINFWAYGGEGRPRTPAANWTEGDDFIGDPPHEPQGWYSVYNNDQTTLDLIKKFTSCGSIFTIYRLNFFVCFYLFLIFLLI